MLFMFADQQAIGVALIVAAISFFVIKSIGIAKIRVLVIEIAQWCAVLSLALSTAAGSIAGYQFGASIQATYQSARPYAGTLTGLVCAAIGGLAAFVVAAFRSRSFSFWRTSPSIHGMKGRGAMRHPSRASLR